MLLIVALLIPVSFAMSNLACGTPVICTMTGGLQDQITDGKEFFGYGIEPAARSIIGSQQIPYIYEDRISKEDFLDSILKFYNLTPEERKEMGRKGREHVLKNFNYEKLQENWVNIMLKTHEKYGSWETRKGYKGWKDKKF